ncbi:aminotransferase [Lobosporangium transversale]|uniref:Aminotransferase n=1 Tax=Lobosporangium transversale TaxID=64571 RepID=A0A1Y2GE70_9FUNG|nr:aminotransferase [Lobosporangium transversale]ORZ08469.1 aminotransferase [Lobosporangium transversale]|eukprot:XP_021878397.1 aminotransferase [Lobosporangium transversale]
MTSFHLLETILYDPKEGFFLLDYHCERMINSAKALGEFFATDPEKFLRDLIPTHSEISNKLDVAIKNLGRNIRQRIRVLLDFDGAISIQSSQLLSETNDFSDSSIIVVLDTEATNSDNPFLHHKTTERAVYNDARDRLKLGPIGPPGTTSGPYDVILYNQNNEIMETSIANIAVEIVDPESGKLEWITPPLSSGLLCGTMRRYLLEKGELREGIIKVDDLKKAALEGRKIKCFNSVRKEYPVTLQL